MICQIYGFLDKKLCFGWFYEYFYSKKQKNAEVVTESHKNQKTPSKGVPTMRVTRNSAKKVL